MAKSLKDILAGVKSSKIEKMDLKDLAMSPEGNKAELDFAAKHKIEKHEDRVGNGDEVYKGKTKRADFKRQSDGVYEESEESDPSLEEKYVGFEKLKGQLASKGAKSPGALAAWIGRKKYGKSKFQKAAASGKKMHESLGMCNHTNEGTYCEMHGEAACPSDDDKGKMEKAKGKKLLLDKKKPMDEAGAFSYGMKTPRKGSLKDLISKQNKKYRDKQPAIEPKDQMVGNAKVVKEHIQYIEEKLTAKDPVSKWIHDFVHSENPRFDGKSTKERQQMALGAYYKKTRNEQADTTIQFPGKLSATTGGTDSDSRV